MYNFMHVNCCGDTGRVVRARAALPVVRARGACGLCLRVLLCAWCVIIVWTLFSAGAGNRWLAWSFLRVNHLLRYIYCIRYFREWEQELNIRSVSTSAQS